MARYQLPKARPSRYAYFELVRAFTGLWAQSSEERSTKRPADLTVRLEYRQEKLHAHVQAQEVACGNVQGSRKTEFKVVGDDYFDGGRVVAWRCLLVEDGHIVAETRSFLWR